MAERVKIRTAFGPSAKRSMESVGGGGRLDECPDEDQFYFVAQEFSCVPREAYFVPQKAYFVPQEAYFAA